MKSTSNDAFRKDLFRYYGREEETLLQRLFRPPELQYLRCFRSSKKARSRFMKLYYRLRLRHLSHKTQIQIPACTQIGEGFYIAHCGRIIINPHAVLGRNINIATGVTIGQTNRGKKKGSPTIKDNCWIGTNAVIVGNVTIGTDVLIAPLAYVNFDVPDHSIVIGNPGQIIPRIDATEEYINQTIEPR